MSAIEIHVGLDIFLYFLFYSVCNQLKTYVECLWETLKWPAKIKVSVIYRAYFTGQSSHFPGIAMEKVLWSYAKSIQVGIFSSMADDHPPQGHMTHTSYLTLT